MCAAKPGVLSSIPTTCNVGKSCPLTFPCILKNEHTSHVQYTHNICKNIKEISRVCLYAWVWVPPIYVHINARGYRWCLFSETTYLVFLNRIPHPVITDEAKLASQCAPGVCLSPPPHCWNVLPDFYGFWALNSGYASAISHFPAQGVFVCF